ncbi:hypothetical protein GCM10023074_49970 [Microbispora amethystogenes]|uniref:Uncharacterized protein n=1 Tax=Microbispora amethystogenes TaxID=1427754 RepID=A0ABQ4FGI7_9ACTN|nr:hypothetical protein Mam01_40430 [Microbispora amethystogenes]
MLGLRKGFAAEVMAGGSSRGAGVCPSLAQKRRGLRPGGSDHEIEGHAAIVLVVGRKLGYPFGVASGSREAPASRWGMG